MTKYSLSGLERLLLEGGVKADSDDSVVHRPEICGDIDIRIARDGTWYYLVPHRPETAREVICIGPATRCIRRFLADNTCRNVQDFGGRRAIQRC